VHEALELRAVNQVEGVLFSGKHFESDAARGGDHAGSLFGGQIARGDRVESQMHQDSQAADAAAFLINFRLRRFVPGDISRNGRGFHKVQYGRGEQFAQ